MSIPQGEAKAQITYSFQLEFDTIPELRVRDLNIACQTVHNVAAVQAKIGISVRQSSAKEVWVAYVESIDIACTIIRRDEWLRFETQWCHSPLLLAMWKDTQTILGREAKYCAGGTF